MAGVQQQPGKPLKLLRRLSFLAAVVFFAAGRAQCGTLTITHQLSFLPHQAFSDNTLDAELLHNPDGIDGDLVRVFGDATVDPTVQPIPRLRVGGDFAANPGDTFSIVYDFNATLTSSAPLELTLGTRTRVNGVIETFTSVVTLTPGTNHYEGSVNAPDIFSLATSGQWKGRLFFGLINGSSSAVLAASLQIDIDHLDFELAAIPEPSSYALLGVGVAVLLLLVRRRLA